MKPRAPQSSAPGTSLPGGASVATREGEKGSGGLEPGSLFRGSYEVVRKLSGGGMGAVYECVHVTTRKRRALKIMHPQLVEDAALRARFELEARVTAEIESDHIVETFDAGIDEATGMPFLVMELLRGDDLDTHVRHRGPLSADETVALLGQAALALDKTHAAGIVHRDLKPQNLFLTTRDDGSYRLKVLDFGIAKVIADSERASRQTATIGTPVYMSPEQIEGQGIEARTDLYALAHVAYAILVGQAYWEEENEASHSHWGTWKIIMAGAREPASVRASRYGVTLPATFDPWFLKATAHAPEDRHDSAASLVSELADALAVPRASRPSHRTVGPRTSALPAAPASTPPDIGTHPTEARSVDGHPPTMVLPETGAPLGRGATRSSTAGVPSSRVASLAAPPPATTTAPISEDLQLHEDPPVTPVRSRAPLLVSGAVALAAVAAVLGLALRNPATVVSASAPVSAPVSAPPLGLPTAAPTPAPTLEAAGPFVSPATSAPSASASSRVPEPQTAPAVRARPPRATPPIPPTAPAPKSAPPTQRGIE